MLADGSSCFDERSEPRSTGRGEPVAQGSLSPPVLEVVEGLSERLFEQVGAVEPLVASLELGELAALGSAEVPRIHQKHEGGALDGAGFVGVSAELAVFVVTRGKAMPEPIRIYM